jgi:hypothetical protein
MSVCEKQRAVWEAGSVRNLGGFWDRLMASWSMMVGI